jgi:hypothetical protein
MKIQSYRDGLFLIKRISSPSPLNRVRAVLHKFKTTRIWVYEKHLIYVRKYRVFLKMEKKQYVKVTSSIVCY